MKHRRTRREQTRDRQQCYDGLENRKDADAANRFIRKAYSSYGRNNKTLEDAESG
ncbi:MAG: hypothetical protein QM793_03595 [Muricomes sp.]